jgi:type VI secretion system secreted protein VgrG
VASTTDRTTRFIPLPGEKTKLGFKSRSSLKGSAADFNEFTFDDKKGQEMVLLHAQKDMQNVVENDQTINVGNDQSVTIERAIRPTR